jgi:hypothetical protein
MGMLAGEEDSLREQFALDIPNRYIFKGNRVSDGLTIPEMFPGDRHYISSAVR